MNEQRYKRQEYFNPKRQKQAAEELLAIIRMFVAQNSLKLNDLIVLDKMIKKLNKEKEHISNKDMSAMERKFQSILKQYQR